MQGMRAAKGLFFAVGGRESETRPRRTGDGWSWSPRSSQVASRCADVWRLGARNIQFATYSPEQRVEFNESESQRVMKQRFLNQKLGKRNSRRAEINKAKRLLNERWQPKPRKGG